MKIATFGITPQKPASLNEASVAKYAKSVGLPSDKLAERAEGVMSEWQAIGEFTGEGLTPLEFAQEMKELREDAAAQFHDLLGQEQELGEPGCFKDDALRTLLVGLAAAKRVEGSES